MEPIKIKALRHLALDRTTYTSGSVFETADPWARNAVRLGHAKLLTDEEYEAALAETDDPGTAETAPPEWATELVAGTVDDVRELIETVADEDLAAVVNAEKAGQNRKGVFDLLESEVDARANSTADEASE